MNTTAARRRPTRPTLETLEGRVVLNASPLDLSFGTAGLVQPSPNTHFGLAIANETRAVGLQTYGKIVELELRQTASPSATNTPLLISRYTSAGKLDLSFGNSGKATIPVPATIDPVSEPRMIVAADGKIIVSYSYSSINGGSQVNQGYVVRLTTTGQLDTSFGTNGVVTLPSTLSRVHDVAVQTDGKIVVVGDTFGPIDASTYSYQFAAARLTTTGALDPSFNGTGQVALNLGTASAGNGFNGQGVALATNGQIYIATSARFNTPPAGVTDSGAGLTDVTRINPNGTIDTTFGSNGTRTLSLSAVVHPAVQTDGKVVLVGYNVQSDSSQKGAFTRLNTDGSDDTTFRTVTGSATSGITPRFDNFAAVVLDGNGSITVVNSSFVARFLSSGAADLSFGLNGLETVQGLGASSLVLTPTGNVLVGGRSVDNQGFNHSVLAQFLPKTIRAVPNDFDGDGKSDVAAQLTDPGTFVYLNTGLGLNIIQGFGQPGPGLTIPATGDYSGDGITDVAAYLPNFGQLAYRVAGVVQDTLLPIGSAGIGATTPAIGDYDGDGLADAAVYVAATGSFVIQLSQARPVDQYPLSTANTVTGPFGQAGARQSIPAPGDYDGDGKTDLAVYLPSLGAFAYRPSAGGPDQIIPFGNVGDGASIPTPGDYDGDGKTDLSVYLPALAIYAYRPSSGGSDALARFGNFGNGATIPAPGDYDGDGKTDLGVFLREDIIVPPRFAYRPSRGGNDVTILFGTTGAGKTIPAASIPYAQARSGGTTSAFRVGAATPTPPTFIPLTDDLTNPTSTGKKKTGGLA